MMPQRLGTGPTQRGLSLLETMVALALVAVIVVAILLAFSSITIAAGRHQEQTSLDRLIRSGAEFIKAQAYSGTYTNMTAPGYTFVNQVLPYDPATNTFATTNPDQGLQEIFLTVTAPSGGMETLYFLKVRP